MIDVKWALANPALKTLQDLRETASKDSDYWALTVAIDYIIGVSQRGIDRDIKRLIEAATADAEMATRIAARSK